MDRVRFIEHEGTRTRGRARVARVARLIPTRARSGTIFPGRPPSIPVEVQQRGGEGDEQ